MVDRVREGTAGDMDLMDSVDRRTRGAAHLGPTTSCCSPSSGWSSTDHSTGSGYAYVERDGSPVLVAATNRRTASALMWEALRRPRPGRRSRSTTSRPPTQWALDVGLAARLAIYTSGYLCLRQHEAAGALPAPRLVALAPRASGRRVRSPSPAPTARRPPRCPRPASRGPPAPGRRRGPRDATARRRPALARTSERSSRTAVRTTAPARTTQSSISTLSWTRRPSPPRRRDRARCPTTSPATSAAGREHRVAAVPRRPHPSGGTVRASAR